jgi:hypothetical protein
MPVTINGSAGVTTNSGAVYNSIQSDTAKTASGTSVDFTGIPSWVKRITVMFNGVSTNGTSQLIIQLGSGSITTTGYIGQAFGSASTVVSNSSTTAGIPTRGGWAASVAQYATIPITNITGNTWVTSFFSVSSDGNNGGGGGSIALGGTLDRIRITTVNGTDTFDAGSINILYE